ncbi:hypothetical protein GEMRC1_014016 [Eukaryota sp. GEM-RC1]
MGNDPSPICEGCRQEPSKLFCTVCHISFCGTCIEKFHPNTIYKSHKILSVEEAILKKLHPCPDHPRIAGNKLLL